MLLRLLAAVSCLLLAPALSAEEAPTGRAIFEQRCSPCHGAAGAGLPGSIPPLADSDFLKTDPRRAIKVLLKGLQGPVTVNGTTYDSVMPAHGFLSDAEIAAVLSFVGQSWGNAVVRVSEADVASVRAETAAEPDVVAACPGRAAGGCRMMRAGGCGGCGGGRAGCAMARPEPAPGSCAGGCGAKGASGPRRQRTHGW